MNRLTITMPDVNLTVEAVDSSLISAILDRFDLSSGAALGRKALPVAAPARRVGRPGAVEGAPVARGSRITRTDIQQVFRQANPSNHEQRILLLGLVAQLKGLERFTTDDVRANAAAIGVSASTIPGSLSKLKAQQLLSTSREGRRAFYSLSAKGKSEAERIRQGLGTAPRRGRKKGSSLGAPAPAMSSAVAPVRRPPGRPRKVDAAVGVRLTKAGQLRQKPGPKPKVGTPLKAKVEAPRKQRGSSVPERRPPTSMDVLSPDDQAKAKALESAPINGDPGALTRLRTPKERSLWVLQSLGAAVSGGIRSTVVSCVLKSRFNLDVPANAVGAALKKSSQSGLVSGSNENGYSITLEGRKFLENAS